MKHDDFSTRMKENYEIRSQTYLPRRGYYLIRLDGKAFHTYTRGMERPFDQTLSSIMDETALYLCKNIAGAKLAYVQSDEISILVTDFDRLDTQAWFDGNVQKIVSISAAMATAEFNRLMYNTNPGFMTSGKVALFDSRVWLIADPYEVENVFIWRQQDARRNSVSMAAQSMFSHKELQGKNVGVMKQMMLDSGTDWETYPAGFRNGRCIVKNIVTEPVGAKKEVVTRGKWMAEPAPLFASNRPYLRSRIPLIPSFTLDEDLMDDDVVRELTSSEQAAIASKVIAPDVLRTQNEGVSNYCPTTPFNDYEG